MIRSSAIAASIISHLAIIAILPLSTALGSTGVPLSSLYEPIPGQPRIVSDGAGGAIIAWVDSRPESHAVYLQRVDANGAAEWKANGVGVSSESRIQQSPQIVSDGAGGAIPTWADYREGEYDIYAQHVNGAGSSLWGAGGAAVCSEAHNQQSPQIVSDGARGAIVTWIDNRAGNYDIYAQRVNGAGSSLWTAGGVAVCREKHEQRYQQIASDGAGGAIIAWADTRNGNWDIYAQRLDADGRPLWERDGISVCAGAQNQVSPQIVSDGAAGAIIAWVDFRNGDYDIYAQRVDAGGAVRWTVNGIGVCAVVLDQVSPQIVTDGAGGAIIAWADRRMGSWDIYAQRMSGAGVAEWVADGAGVCTAQRDQFSPQITADGAGGAIVAWMDSRNGNNDVFAQRVSAAGRMQWTANGVTVCFERHDQRYPQVAADGAGGAIIAWADFRRGAYDIYAQRANAAGLSSWAANGIVIFSQPKNPARR